MMPILSALGLIGLAYLVGSIPTAYLLAKWLKGIDIRRVGSGNVGSTNSLLTLGLLAGLTVFFFKTQAAGC